MGSLPTNQARTLSNRFSGAILSKRTEQSYREVSPIALVVTTDSNTSEASNQADPSKPKSANPEKKPAKIRIEPVSVDINDEVYVAKTQKDLDELNFLKVLAQEEMGHWQQWKQMLILFTFLSLVAMNLFIDGYFGVPITPCGWTYFLVQLGFVIECFIITWIAVKWNNAEL